jgi:hypothetical protein
MRSLFATPRRSGAKIAKRESQHYLARRSSKGRMVWRLRSAGRRTAIQSIEQRPTSGQVGTNCPQGRGYRPPPSVKPNLGRQAALIWRRHGSPLIFASESPFKIEFKRQSYSAVLNKSAGGPLQRIGWDADSVMLSLQTYGCLCAAKALMNLPGVRGGGVWDQGIGLDIVTQPDLGAARSSSNGQSRRVTAGSAVGSGAPTSSSSR